MRHYREDQRARPWLGRPDACWLDHRSAPLRLRIRELYMELVFLFVQITIVVLLLAVLGAMKSGFNEVISGLESLDRRLGD